MNNIIAESYMSLTCYSGILLSHVWLSRRLSFLSVVCIVGVIIIFHFPGSSLRKLISLGGVDRSANHVLLRVRRDSRLGLSTCHSGCTFNSITAFACFNLFFGL